MGEAKRRKILDPNFGKHLVTKIEIKGTLYVLRNINLYALIAVDLNKSTFQMDTPPNQNEDENKFIELFLTNLLQNLLAYSGIHATEFLFNLNCTKLEKEKELPVALSTDIQELSIKKMRGWLTCSEPLSTILKKLNNSSETVNENALNTDRFERNSPKEHTRSAHMRRVAYGKGRALRKWVEIAETVVNAG